MVTSPRLSPLPWRIEDSAIAPGLVNVVAANDHCVAAGVERQDGERIVTAVTWLPALVERMRSIHRSADEAIASVEGR